VEQSRFNLNGEIEEEIGPTLIPLAFIFDGALKRYRQIIVYPPLSVDLILVECRARYEVISVCHCRTFLKQLSQVPRVSFSCLHSEPKRLFPILNASSYSWLNVG
jgi:hypothetical protein